MGKWHYVEYICERGKVGMWSWFKVKPPRLKYVTAAQLSAAPMYFDDRIKAIGKVKRVKIFRDNKTGVQK